MEALNTIRLKRRTLLKGLGVVGLASLGTSFLTLRQANGTPLPRFRLKASDYRTFQSTCAMECLHCNLTAYVWKDRLMKIEATKGFNVKCCLRGISRTKWVYHPLRLTQPLLRTGEKGEGKFKPITWNAALDLIEEKIRETLATDGNKGLLLTAASGNMDSIKNDMGKAFFDYLGGSTKHTGSLCCAAVTAAMMPMVGLRYADTRDTIAESRYILCWGNNPAVTMHAYFKHYSQAQRNGARLVVIDPRFNETAAKADEWVPIVPGTDIALALGMINIIMQENRHDADFLRAHTGAVYLVDDQQQLMRADPQDKDSYLVFDTVTKTLKRHDEAGVVPALLSEELPTDSAFTTVLDAVWEQAKPWTPQKVEAETDVPAQTVLRLARDYASTQPAMIIQNMSGAQRTEFGTYVAASQFYLALITGNIGKRGAGVCDAGGVRQMAKFSPIIPPAPNAAKIPRYPFLKSATGSLMRNRILLSSGGT